MGWFRIDRVTWGERVLWAAFVAFSVAPVALQPNAEEVARAYVDAVNRGDVGAALSLTTTDFVIRPTEGGYFFREDRARQVLEWRAALHERWQVVSWTYNPEDREVHADMRITNDVWVLVDRPPTVSMTLVVRGGRLLTESVRVDTRPLRQAFRPFLRWASRERPRELDKVWSGRQPVRTAEAARGLLGLMREWRAAEGAVDGAPAEEQA